MEFPQTISTQITEQIMRSFSSYNPNRILEISNSQYNKIFSTIYNTLKEVGIDERFDKDWDAVQNYKKMIRKRHEKGVEGLHELFPNGMYTKDREGNLVGIDVIMKTNIRNLIQLALDETP